MLLFNNVYFFKHRPAIQSELGAYFGPSFQLGPKFSTQCFGYMHDVGKNPMQISEISTKYLARAYLTNAQGHNFWH